MRKLCVTALSLTLLSGCGGGSSDNKVLDEGGLTESKEPNDSAIKSVNPDGIFLNKAGTASLVVDIENNVVKVFKTNSSDVIYDIESVSYSEEGIVKLSGVTVISEDAWKNSDDQVVSLTYSVDGINATFEYSDAQSGDNANQRVSVIETFVKQADSLPMTKLEGSYSSVIDETNKYIVDENGNLILNPDWSPASEGNTSTDKYIVNEHGNVILNPAWSPASESNTSTNKYIVSENGSIILNPDWSPSSEGNTSTNKYIVSENGSIILNPAWSAPAEWILSTDGSVSVNAFCTFSGALKPVKFYYTIKLTASGCGTNFAQYEGQTYDGIAYTIEKLKQPYLVGSVSNSNKNLALWDIVELNN